MRHDSGPQAVTPGGHLTTDSPAKAKSAASVTFAADIAAVLRLSDERDQWQAIALARERAAYERGYRDGQADGWRAGYETRYAELEKAWHEAARHAAHGDPRSYAELERRRRSDAA